MASATHPPASEGEEVLLENVVKTKPRTTSVYGGSYYINIPSHFRVRLSIEKGDLLRPVLDSERRILAFEVVEGDDTDRE